jgi:hypothetical protein
MKQDRKERKGQTEPPGQQRESWCAGTADEPHADENLLLLGAGKPEPEQKDEFGSMHARGCTFASV